MEKTFLIKQLLEQTFVQFELTLNEHQLVSYLLTVTFSMRKYIYIDRKKGAKRICNKEAGVGLKRNHICFTRNTIAVNVILESCLFVQNVLSMCF